MTIKYVKIIFVDCAHTLPSLEPSRTWVNAHTPYAVRYYNISNSPKKNTIGDIDADTCRHEWNRLPQEEKDKYGYVFHYRVAKYDHEV